MIDFWLSIDFYIWVTFDWLFIIHCFRGNENDYGVADIQKKLTKLKQEFNLRRHLIYVILLSLSLWIITIFTNLHGETIHYFHLGHHLIIFVGILRDTIKGLRDLHSHDKESKLKEEKIAASHFQLGKICFECTRHTLPALHTVMHLKIPPSHILQKKFYCKVQIIVC